MTSSVWTVFCMTCQSTLCCSFLKCPDTHTHTHLGNLRLGSWAPLHFLEVIIQLSQLVLAAWRSLRQTSPSALIRHSSSSHVDIHNATLQTFSRTGCDGAFQSLRIPACILIGSEFPQSLVLTGFLKAIFNVLSECLKGVSPLEDFTSEDVCFPLRST